MGSLALEIKARARSAHDTVFAERAERAPRPSLAGYRAIMNDPGEKQLAGWTVEDHLAFDIGFALPRTPVRGLRRATTRANG
jgi:hypothetical protein